MRHLPLLIFANPKSGTGHAKKMLVDQLVPALDKKNITYEIIYTKYSGHALETVKNLDKDKYCGIIVVSGDGVVNEIFNGLFLRDDWNDGNTLPIGLIPGGSGCALNCSLLRQLNQPLDGLNNLGPDASVVNVAQGVNKIRTVPLDLIELDLSDGSKKQSFLGVTMGVIADTDIGSEWLRFIGFVRAYIYAVWRAIFPIYYHVRVSYIPLEIDENTGKPIPVTSEFTIPKLDEALPDNWITVENEYHIVYAINISSLDPVTVFAPDSQIGDGIIWLILVKKSITRKEIINWFLTLSDGPDLSSPNISLIPVRAFRLIPLSPQNGILSLDGEKSIYGAVQGRILPQKAKIFADTSD